MDADAVFNLFLRNKKYYLDALSALRIGLAAA
jgi:hypothetical protein